MCEPAELPVVWSLSNSSAAFTLAFDNGLTLDAGAKVKSGRVVFDYQFHNNIGQGLSDIRVDICVQTQHLPEIVDYASRRTFFPVDGRFQPVGKLVPESMVNEAPATCAHRFY